MKNKLLKLCISLCAVCFGLATICLIISNSAKSYAYEVVLEEGASIAEEYDFGTTFDVPSASFKVDEESIPATYYVINPTGAILTDSKIALNKEGKYTVVYSARIDGKNVKDTSKTFLVYNNPWKYNFQSTTAQFENESKMATRITAADLSKENFNGNVIVRFGIDEPDFENEATEEKFVVVEINNVKYVYKTELDEEGNIVKTNKDTGTDAYILQVDKDGNSIYEVSYEEDVITAITLKQNVGAPIYKIARDNLGNVSYSAIGDYSIRKYDYVPALHLTLAQSDTWTYNKIVDVNEDGSVPIISFFPWNCSQRTVLIKDGEPQYSQNYSTKEKVLNRETLREAAQINVKMTDVYDENNYLIFHIYYYQLTSYRVQVYTSIEFNGVAPLGLQPSDTGAYTVLGKNYAVSTGKVSSGSYSYNGYICASSGIKLYYDTETQIVKIYDGQQTLVVSQLNNEMIYPNSTFKGFTTGEVYVSVYADENIDPQTNYDILSIKNYGIEDLQENSKVTDTKEPLIVLDIDEKLVKNGFSIAKGEEFEIFGAKAYDPNLYGTIQTVVYQNYGTPYETMCMSLGGKFTPKQVGEYAIVYSAKDAFGNESSKVITLTCVNTEAGKSIDLEMGDFLNEYNLAQEYTLPAYSFNGINKTSIDYSIELYKGDKLISEIDTSNNKFMVSEGAGDYKFVFKYTDGFKSYVSEFEVTFVASDNVIFDTASIFFPEYFLKDMGYTFDAVYAYTFDTGVAVKNVASLKVSEDGGEYKDVNYYDFTVNANNTIKFKYTFGDASYESEELPVIVAVDKTKSVFKERYNQSEYFQGVSKTTQQEQNYLTYTMEDGFVGNATLKFVNVISINNFKLEFSVPTEYSNFSAVSVDLIDYYNRDFKYTVVYTKVGDQVTYKLSGGVASTIARSFSGTDTHRFEFSKNTFKEKSGAVKTLDIPFTSDRVLLYVTLVGVNGPSAINIHGINGQSFGQYATDAQSTIYVAENFKGMFAVGSTVTVLPAQVSDIMNPYNGSKLKTTVYYGAANENNYVKSLDNVQLKFNNSKEFAEDSYQFKLDKVGNFSIKYEYSVESERTVSKTILCQAVDITPPTFQIKKDGMVYNKDTEVTVTKGYSLTLPTIEATDDITSIGQITQRIIVIDPHDMSEVVTSASYKFTLKGTYRFIYLAFDGSGNYTSDWFLVNVQ